MLLNDPVTLLLIIIPFGLMTTLMLCLSYVGTGNRRAALRWWIAGDLVLAAYRAVDLLQPGVISQDLGWLGVLSPQSAFIGNTAGLLAAIGCHTLALHQLADMPRKGIWQLRLLLTPVLVYGIGATVLLHNPLMLAWFFAFCVITIGIQFSITLPLRRRFRGAWALLAGHVALLLFHGYSTATLAIDPPPALSFDEPDMFSLPALAMDFMVSFLFTLSFALMLQEQLRQQVLQLSITDTLTGALNRRGAVPKILGHGWQQRAPQRYPLAVAMIDLDNFKRINDQHGHLAGDEALQLFSSTVLGLKRRDDIFVRWGGEEFLLVLPGTDVQQAQTFMARLREVLNAKPATTNLPLQIGFSAGLAQTSSLNSQHDFEALLRSVDKALYRAKRIRGRVEVVEAIDV